MSGTGQEGTGAARLRRRVLVIDDVRSDRDRVERWLVDDGRYRIVTAADGAEARAAIAAERPDCIVLDYVLGDESGLDLLVELSPPGDDNRIPVVMLTGAGHAAVATEALRRGAEDCLIKGAASAEVVRHAVHSAIEKATVRRSEARQESAEAEARLAIQVAERRASYLAEATRRLAAATDVETTLDRLARLAVPFIADRVIIDLVDRAGVPTHRTVVDSGPTDEPLPDEPDEGFDQDHPTAHVLRTGETEVHLARDDGTVDAALTAAVTAPGGRPPSAVLVVPLLHAGNPIGAMTLVSFDPLRTYDTPERLVAEEIALRGSLAIGNASGLATRRRADAATADSTRLLRTLATISTTLSRPLEPAQALRRVTEQAVPALGAAAAVSLTSDGDLPVVAEHDEGPALRSVDHEALREARQAARMTARDLSATAERAVTGPDGGTVATVLAVPLRTGDRTIGVLETIVAGADGIDDATRTVTEDAARRVSAYLGRIRAAQEQGAIDAALQSSEQKLQLALGAAGAGVFEIHGDPLVVDLDDAHAKLWGFPPGTGPIPLDDALANMAPEGRDELRERLLSALDEGSPFELEYRTQGSAGDRWLLSRGQQLAWHGETNRPHLVGVTLDISQRRRLTEQLARDSERTRRLQRATAALSGAVDRAAVNSALSDTVAAAAGAVDVAVLLSDESTIGALPDDETVSDKLLTTLRRTRDDAREDPETPVGLQRVEGDDRDWFKVLPLRSAGANVGAIALRFTDPPAVDDDFHRFMMSLTRQIAVALDRAQLFERERQIAESLQRRLLPQQLPVRDDAELAARYLPANTEVQVGGDWYDAIELDDGGFVFAVGDVMGHGVAAASAMGQLRVGLRALATVDPAPGAIIAAADRLAGDLLPDRYATVCIGRTSRGDDGGHLVRLASAGHQPVLLVEPDGAADWVDLVATVPIGVACQVGLDDPVDELTVQVPPGTTMLLYTDGLVEHPGEDLDAGQARLREAAGRIFADACDDLGASCDRLIEVMVDTERRSDDIALLAVRLR
jgi:serine phosphatase RsbU (regulator of sigma subunit)/FixJ family two-component response regulator